MTVEILSVNLDSLYLTVKGDLKPAVGELLAAAKQQAQDDDENGARLFFDNRVAGGTFFVSRSGRGRDYPYILYNSRFRISLTTRGGNRPTALVQIRSDLLYEYELPVINTMLLRLFSNLVEDPAMSMKVSRADIACDFQGEDWVMPRIEAGLSRARKDHLWREHGKTTGITYGQHQSALQAQIYRKSETLKNDGKEWFHEVWAAENPRYNRELPVYRFELRFYREGLRLMKDSGGEGLDTLWNLHNSLADLCEYAICGDKPWIRFVSPRHIEAGHDRSHSCDWDDADWWLLVRSAFGRLSGSEARKRVNDELRFHYRSSIERAVSHLKTAASVARLAGWHPATNPAKFASDALTCFFAENPLEWAELINEKTAQLQGHFSSHVVEVA